MKKIVFLLVLFSVLAGAAFAQLTFSGDAYAGVEVKKPYEEDENFGLNFRDSGTATAPQFNFAAIATKENYGVKLDTSFIFPLAMPQVRLNGIYGWVNFLDNALRLSIGKISDAVWVTSLDNEYKWDDVTGFRVEYKTPLQGLNVGLAFDAEDRDAETFFKQIVFGASYVNPLFNTVFGYDMGSNARALFGFNFTGIDELSAAGIEIAATDLALWDKLGALRVDESLAYRVTRPLTVSLYMWQHFSGVEDADFGLSFMPGASYKLTNTLTASLNVEVFSEDSFDTANLRLLPCLEYTLKGPALFYVEYEMFLAEFEKPSHFFRFGMEIKAF
jgi:hypothetical protein